VGKLVAVVEGVTQGEGIREEGAWDNIWAWEGRCNRVWKKVLNEEVNNLYVSTKLFRVI
jgi:hypothetical protein